MQDMDIEDDMEVYGDTPGGGDMEYVTPDGNIMNQQEMPIERKLQLAERANEIYREQVKYLQEHLNSIRALVQDKESIIENLMLRYDLGILVQDASRAADYVPSDKIEDKELRRKAEALAQRTILENFELRELVNELRDENFHLRNEIYDLQDKLNRQALLISKMNKNMPMQNQMNQFVPQEPVGDEFIMTNGSVHPNAMTEESQHKREERAAKHTRQQSSMAQPKDFWEDNQPQEEEEDEEETDGVAKPRKVEPEVSANQEFGQENEDQEDFDQDREQEDDEEHRDEEAKKKMEERKAKAHERKATLETPENFFNEDYEVDGDTPDDPNQTNNPSNSQSNSDRPNKRRGSKKLDVNLLKNSEEAKNKRQERAEKDHTRKESNAPPNNMFETDYANTEEAKKLREERAKKARKESIAVPKGFLNTEDVQDSEDDASREKRRKHQRKQSLMKAVGDKGHLSDEDTEKTQHVEYETRRKLDKSTRMKSKEPTIPENEDAATKNANANNSILPRESIRATVTGVGTELQFEDPAVLLMAQEEVRTLKEQVAKLEESKKTAEKQFQDYKKEAEQKEQKLSQQLKTQMEEKFQQEKNGLLATAKQDRDKTSSQIDDLKKQMNELKDQLTQTTNSKMKLIQRTTNELNCLNRVINRLLQSEKCKEITQLLLDDCRHS